MTAKNLGVPATIMDLLFASGQADTFPAILGVDGASVTHGRLRAETGACAAALAGLGFRSSDRMALALPNGPMLGVALVAVSAAACCAPLNPGYRRQEFERLLVKLKAKAVIVKRGDLSPAREVARGHGIEVLEVDDPTTGESPLMGKLGEGGEARYSEPLMDAYLLHTSGTTGTPKLVPLTQTNICHSVHYIRNAMELGPGDRCLNVMPLFHGLGLVSLLSTLLSGGSIACAPTFSKDDFFAWLEMLKPTWYTAVPPVHQEVLDGAAKHRAEVGNSRLRFIRSAAAPLRPKLMLGLEACFQAPVVEAYGMTEAFIIASTPLPPRKRKPGSVGVAMGPEMAVMGEGGRLLGVGESGEIVVRGPNVMRGYEGDEEENARSFTDGWFRTGDLGHVDGEGFIYIDGRVKEAINRGGEKVTPNEVDDALGEHPSVLEAASFGLAHEALGEDLAAAVVLREGSSATEGELRLFVSERLASYKVPSRIFFVREIPKGPSGKVLRRRLPEVALAWRPVEEAAAKARRAPIHRVFEEVAAREPTRLALRHNKIEMTYGGLNARANRLARLLMAEGAGPGRFVGVCMERSADFVTSILAVLKAGAAYVPLYPSDPTKRLGAYIEEAGIELAITKKVYEQKLPPSLNRAYFQGAMESSKNLDSGNMTIEDDPERPAYALFIPSPSGRARGVPVPHGAVTGLVLGREIADVGPGDVVALQSSPDTSLVEWEMWSALLNGARLAVFDLRTILSPRDFSRRLGEEGVSVLGLNTPFFNLFAREVPWAFRGIKTLVFTGEAADPDAVRAVLKNGPPGRLIHAYGSAETGGFSTWHLIREAPGPDAPIPVGKALSGTRAYILDERLRPVQPGSAGDLFVGGGGLALGYISRDGATGEAFLPDPFSPGGMMHRTGDIARVNRSGEIELLGRRDRRVEVHGFRVELGEVEAALSEHPAVKASMVSLSRVGGRGEGRVVAYAVPSTKDVPTVDELHRFLTQTLHEYMIPSQFHWVEELPSPAGTAAPVMAPATGRGGAGSSDAGRPADQTERRLIAIWEREMGIEGIAPGDNFFQMGGYSLMAVRIFSRMEKEFGVRLPLATMYRKPTVAEIAGELRKAQPRLKSLIPMRAEGGRPRLFLVHAVDGEVYNYGSLVETLGEDQPVYGFRAAGIYDSEPLPKTIEEMAAGYIREMKSVQPHGPYHLAGRCAGAPVALEMAQQLRVGGDEVGLLAFFDYEPPDPHNRRSRRQVRGIMLKEVLFLGADLLRYAKKRRLGDLKIPWRVARLEKLAMMALGLIRADGIILSGEFAPLPENWKAEILSHLSALQRYRFSPYGGVITVFKKELFPTVGSPDPSDGWRPYAKGGLVVEVTQGRIHGDMLRPPGAIAVARKIREMIDWHEAWARRRG